MHFASIGEVVSAVACAVDFYNNERPHMSIDMMTPSMAARCDGEIPKRWISYRERAIRKKQTQVLEIPENSLPLSAIQGAVNPCRDKAWGDNQKQG